MVSIIQEYIKNTSEAAEELTHSCEKMENMAAFEYDI